MTIVWSTSCLEGAGNPGQGEGVRNSPVIRNGLVYVERDPTEVVVPYCFLDFLQIFLESSLLSSLVSRLIAALPQLLLGDIRLARAASDARRRGKCNWKTPRLTKWSVDWLTQWVTQGVWGGKKGGKSILYNFAMKAF